jgi:hypothetical protein
MTDFKPGDLVTWVNFGNGTKRQPGRKDLTDRGYSVGTKAIVLEFLEEHPKLEPGRTGVRLRWLRDFLPRWAYIIDRAGETP